MYSYCRGDDWVLAVAYECYAPALTNSAELQVPGLEVTEFAASMRAYREITFTAARAVRQTKLPAQPKLLRGTEVEYLGVGELIVFDRSSLIDDARSVWRMVSNTHPPRLKHYILQFLSTGKGYQVIAQGVSISPEILWV